MGGSRDERHAPPSPSGDPRCGWRFSRSGLPECPWPCPTGYTGPHCEVDIDECDPDPCHYGSCKDGVATFTCLCRPGYTGHHCETNVNECHSQPCRHGGTCQDRDNAYLCLCLRGTTGARAGRAGALGALGGPGADLQCCRRQDPTARPTWMTVPATPVTRARVWTRLTATSVHVSRATQVSGPGATGALSLPGLLRPTGAEVTVSDAAGSPGGRDGAGLHSGPSSQAASRGWLWQRPREAWGSDRDPDGHPPASCPWSGRTPGHASCVCPGGVSGPLWAGTGLEPGAPGPAGWRCAPG